MKNPEISVIMGMYNCADTLSEAIESILNQTMKEWELIMCDDGSSLRNGEGLHLCSVLRSGRAL